MNNMSPEGFRTAAYLAAKARLDARKTSRNVQCNPPNTRCGNRCIPPSWDCRLKGEGADNHLKAVKTDPLGGLANIERGVKRLGKGVLKGSPSDIHGGKQAIIRGVVKIAPGDLKKKEELRKQLERRTLLIGSGLAVLGLGLGAHALLMKNNVYGYRYGVGKNINEAVHTGVSRILDATPVLGGVRAQNRLGALSSVSEAVTRAARDPSLSPEALLTGLESNNPNVLRHLNELDIGSSNRNGNSNLNGALQAVNARARERGSTNNYAWNDQHREAFWGATVSGSSMGKGVPDRVSVFAGPATEDYLRRQHNLNVGRNASTSELKAALTSKLIEERENHVAFAKQLGLKTRKVGGYEVIDKDSMHDYIRAVNRRAGITGSGVSKAIKDEADKHLRELMNPRSLATYSDSIYKQSLIGFDKFYKDVAQRVQIAPGASSLSESFRMRSAAQSVVSGASRGIQPSLRDSEQMLVRSLDRVRVSEMARQMNLPRNTVMGDAHSALISNAYFATRVAGGRRSTYSITDRLAVSAASELAGREITSTTDAFRLLQSEYGFTGATRVRAPAPTTQSGARRSGGLRGQAQLSELARRIMARAGNEGMTMEAALLQARRERGDGDDFSPELVRTATYLAARADFKEGNRRGKPCGASHIPKAHECRKGRGAVAPQAQAQGKGRAVAAVVAAAGLTTAGILAYRGRQTLVPNLSQKTIRALSSDQVKKGLDRIPSRFQSQARQLVGDAKLATAHMTLRAQGAQIRAVDVSNNFSTWVTPNGTHLSVGSVGDSLLTFGAERKGKVANFPQYGLGFTVDTTFDSKGGMPPSQAKQLIATTKAMFKSQMEMLPDDAFLFAVPHKDDGLGGKRKSIYEKMGFTAVPGVRGDRLWALKNQGAFTKIPPEQFDYIRDLIRGDAADSLARTSPRKGKPCGESFIPKTHECRQKARNQAVKVALTAGALVGTAYALKKAKIGEFHTGVMTGNVGGLRKRRMSFMEKHQPAMDSTELASIFTKLKDQKDVIPENVDALQAFVKKNKIVNDPSRFYKDLEDAMKLESAMSATERTTALKQLKLLNTLGGFDGLSSQYSNNVYVRSMRKSAGKLNADTADVTSAVSDFISNRNGSFEVSPTEGKRFKKLFTISNSATNGDTAEYINTIHEIAHSVHFKASKNNGSSSDDIGRGLVYNPVNNPEFFVRQKTSYTEGKAELNRQLYAASSGYGRSDHNGRQVETFAELSVLYIAQGAKFKRQYPLAYAWVDDIWSKANG